MRNITIAAIQMACGQNRMENIKKADHMAHTAAERGANLILLPELFETPYFCQERKYSHYQYALPLQENLAVQTLRKTAEECHVVIPVSFYEKAGTVLYNTVAVIHTDGEIMGVYRKTHIPDDHFYQEKFYFTPGNTGFKVWDTEYGKIGVGICWDQWFPEVARAMALMGAEILLYPTAIGSEPVLGCDSMPHWRRCMQGHAAANIIPVAAANRIGTENIEPCEENNRQSSSLDFYGSSFITDCTGEIVRQAGREKEEIILYTTDLDENLEMRMSWGVFRDRRPEQYGVLIE